MRVKYRGDNDSALLDTGQMNWKKPSRETHLPAAGILRFHSALLEIARFVSCENSSIGFLHCRTAGENYCRRDSHLGPRLCRPRLAAALRKHQDDGRFRARLLSLRAAAGSRRTQPWSVTNAASGCVLDANKCSFVPRAKSQQAFARFPAQIPLPNWMEQKPHR